MEQTQHTALIEALKVSAEALRQLASGVSSSEILANLDLNDDYLIFLSEALENPGIEI